VSCPNVFHKKFRLKVWASCKARRLLFTYFPAPFRAAAGGSRANKNSIQLLRALLRSLGAVRVDILCPLKGGGHKAHIVFRHCQHPPRAGRAAALAVNGHPCLTRAQRRYIGRMPGQDAHVAVNGPHDELFRLAVEETSVRRHDLKMKG